MSDIHPIDSGAAAGAPGLGPRLAELASAGLREEYSRQGAFLHVPEFLPQPITERLITVATAAEPLIHRNYLPGHKQGGSVSRHAIDSHAPFIAELYRSSALIEWLGELAGERLQASPPEDPHAYALYFYTRPGDHIGWHYDTSYYAGRRYTLFSASSIDRPAASTTSCTHAKPASPRLRARSASPPGDWFFSTATN